MTRMIGIRREDKNRWERRAPLTPEHVAELTRHGVPVVVEPSPLRVFPDEAYRAAGARLVDDLSSCPVVVGAVRNDPPGVWSSLNQRTPDATTF